MSPLLALSPHSTSANPTNQQGPGNPDGEFLWDRANCHFYDVKKPRGLERPGEPEIEVVRPASRYQYYQVPSYIASAPVRGMRMWYTDVNGDRTWTGFREELEAQDGIGGDEL